MSEPLDENEKLAKEQQRIQDKAALDIEWEKKKFDLYMQLKSNPEVQAYLAPYKVYWHDNFLEGYASRVIDTQRWGDGYEKMEENSVEYLERADEALGEIQMKKLYDMRTLWGAEMLAIAGVESSADFYHIAADIMNSQVIAPITRAEVELYKEYMLSGHYEYNNYKLSWHDLETIRTEGEDEDMDHKYPAWFTYHDEHSGDHVATDLKDIRGEKEAWYQDLASQEARKLSAAESQEKTAPVEEELKNLFGGYDELIDFMEQFGDAATIRRFNLMCKYGGFSLSGYVEEGEDYDYDEDEDEDSEDSDYLNEQVEDIIQNLSSMKGFRLPIAAHKDWRVALIAAWDGFQRDKTLAALPSAYLNYQFRLKSKIAMPKYKEERNTEFWIKYIREDILKGRALNGEPEDFNF